ncbi:hypothetical protein L226DRAFT_574818 [Lentinus tigrinus ALCF2SS1-7]|uniref:Uncharacterized protein n=1 Tax=Lentinus tigrinus ALCF2SS1-6 TaxID=1328759 RepID=A0A5C2RVU2_9APHY|nr:hypothetical protein L227DRAFT_615646 [Lentinus tigrinus ALCF2SS1-6]RPD70287.1 hypothetical protein L226DRAFT_574818 [Lentinus tigrinus ALCF2SS1-7]
MLPYCASADLALPCCVSADFVPPYIAAVYKTYQQTITLSDFENSDDLRFGILSFRAGAETMTFIVFTLLPEVSSLALSRNAAGLHLSSRSPGNIMCLTIDLAGESFGSYAGLSEVFAVLRTITHVKIPGGIHGVVSFGRSVLPHLRRPIYGRRLREPSSRPHIVPYRRPTSDRAESHFLLHGSQYCPDGLARF